MMEKYKNGDALPGRVRKEKRRNIVVIVLFFRESLWQPMLRAMRVMYLPTLKVLGALIQGRSVTLTAVPAMAR